MDAWNTGLGGLGPSFAWADDADNADLTISGSGGTYSCGATPSRSSIIIMAKSGSTCSTSWSSDVGTVLVHEFAHVLGFQSILHQATEVPTNCTIHLPDDHSISPTLCQHEIEMVLAAYKYTTLDSSQVPQFWASRIVTGVQLSPSSITIEEEQTGTVAVQALRYSRQAPPATGIPGTATLTWVNDPSALQIMSSSNTSATIKGLESQSTKLRVRIASATSARVGALAKHFGDSVSVTVTAAPPDPPPGAGFRVSSIDGPSLPITQAGFYWLEANVVNQPGYDRYTKWDINYSGGVHAPVNTGFVSGDRYRLIIPEGSYTITVTATPRSNSITGFPLTVDYPVCTDGSGGGGGNQNAVGGC